LVNEKTIHPKLELYVKEQILPIITLPPILPQPPMVPNPQDQNQIQDLAPKSPMYIERSPPFNSSPAQPTSSVDLAIPTSSAHDRAHK
jgi:hypothetical protein